MKRKIDIVRPCFRCPHRNPTPRQRREHSERYRGLAGARTGGSNK
jgi:hypothetical protein